MLSLVHVLFTDKKPLSILIILRLSCSHFYQSVLAPFVQKVGDPIHKILRTPGCILWIVQYYWFFISTVHWMVIYPIDSALCNVKATGACTTRQWYDSKMKRYFFSSLVSHFAQNVIKRQSYSLQNRCNNNNCND